MFSDWIVYTAITVIYIIILVVYFLRRSKVHEKELKHFLDLAQQQLDAHKAQASAEAATKVAQATAVVKRVQAAAQMFEDQAKTEYDKIISDAKEERRDLIAKAKAEIEQLFKDAEVELAAYKVERHREIEKNLVKLVVAVSERVVEQSLSAGSHKDLIYQALAEITQERERG